MTTNGENAYAVLSGLIGQSEGSGEWFQVDQKRINEFAEVTEDRQFIHVDPEACATMSPWGVPIAHGFLTLSLLPVLGSMTEGARIDNVKMGVNYGGNKTRFISPVRSGKRVRAHTKLVELIEKRPGQWQQTNEITIEIEGEDKPALITEWITQLFV